MLNAEETEGAHQTVRDAFPDMDDDIIEDFINIARQMCYMDNYIRFPSEETGRVIAKLIHTMKC